MNIRENGFSKEYFCLDVRKKISLLKLKFNIQLERFHPPYHGEFIENVPKLPQDCSPENKVCKTFVKFKNTICKKNRCAEEYRKCHSKFIQDLNSLYIEYCLDLLEKFSSGIEEPSLYSLSQRSLSFFKIIINNAIEFMLQLPIVPKYFSTKVVIFLRKLILSGNLYDKKFVSSRNLNECTSYHNRLEMYILIVMLHFGPKAVVTEEFCEPLLNIFLSSHTSEILFFHMKSFKEFSLLLKTVIQNIQKNLNPYNPFIEFIDKITDLNVTLLNMDIILYSNTNKLWIYKEVLEILFDEQNNMWNLKDLSKKGTKILSMYIRELMKSTRYLTKQSYKSLLKTLCSIISKEISKFYMTKSTSYMDVTHSIGGILLSENKDLLLEIIYFLEMNNLKYMINSEIIDKILKFNLRWTENIPEKYCDPITLQIMKDPVQLLPSPEMVDYSTYLKLQSTNGLNPFTRGKLKLQFCPALKSEISQWRYSTSFTFHEIRNSYIGKFLYYYDEVENLSKLFKI